MNDIAETIGQLATTIEHQPSVVRIWTVATLASSLGLEVIVSAQAELAEAIVEVGELWVDKVAETLEDDPDRQADTLRAASVCGHPGALLGRDRHVEG